jgi:hypothetical protein
MENWYYVSPKTDESVGPVSIGKLIDEATPETMVWKEESLPEWVAAKAHPDLADFLDNLAENNNSNIIPSVEENQVGVIQNGPNSVEKSCNLLIQMPTLGAVLFAFDNQTDLKYGLYFDDEYFTTLNTLGTSDELLVRYNTDKTNIVLKIEVKGIISLTGFFFGGQKTSFEENREIIFENIITKNVTKITINATPLIPLARWGKIRKFKDVEFTTLFRDDNFVEV